MENIEYVRESVKNMSEGMKSSAATALGGAIAVVEDNMEMIFKCAVTVGAGYILWKLFNPDVVAVDTDEETDSDMSETGGDTDEETDSEMSEKVGFPHLPKNKTKGDDNAEDIESTRLNMESFKGKWKRTSSSQYEEFLSALDVNFMLRKAATVSTPVMEITEEDGVWSIRTSTILKSMELKFKIGEEFDEKTPDGRDVRAIVRLEGNKLVSVQKAKNPGEKGTTVIREFNGDECIKTSTVDGEEDLVCVEKFKRIV